MLERVITQQRKAELFIHLGDCVSDLENATIIFPEIQYLNVKGNCDFGSDTPVDGETVIKGKRIFFTHGHAYHVKSGYSIAIGEARRRNADILLFGHTHMPFSTYEDGLYIMNPGSIGHPKEGAATYGIIDITDAGVVMNVVEV